MKMAQGATGGAGKGVDTQGQKLSSINSKRRRMDQPTTMSKSSSSGLRGSTAIPASAEALVSSSKHTQAVSIGQAGQEASNFVPDERRVYQHNSKSNPSIGQEIFTVTRLPTLYAKRGDNDSTIPRRKSSKRKAEEQAREREVRAMSSPIPIPKRPLSYGEGPLRRATQKAPNRLRKTADRHASEVSIPIAESWTDISITSSQNSFKVSALDMLSPRPTVRYSRNPRYIESKSQIISKNLAPHTIVEEDNSSKKRIDDLADNLDAGALRELMERDNRRRERKRKADQVKLEQKLKRTAAYERGQEGRGRDIGDVGKTDAGIGSSLDGPQLRDDGRDFSADPFSDNGQLGAEPPVPPKLRQGSSIYTGTSQASLSPPTSPTQRAVDCASISQASGLRRETTPDIIDTGKLSHDVSEQSNVQLASWTSFFRRGGNRGKRSSMDRGRDGSGEFSNTSRNSISKNQPQASLVGKPRTFQRSGTPQRTQSKFREDLPELPLSPPDSRVQSPEIGKGPALLSDPPSQFESTTDAGRFLANSSSRATCDQDLNDDQSNPLQTNEPQTSPPAAALSRSLASVDSEASWLSGKPAKRSSVQHDHPLRQSQSSLQPRLLGSEIGDEVDAAEERCRSSPNSALQQASSRVVNVDPESDSEGEPGVPPSQDATSERWHSSLGRQPTLIRQAAQARSREGLLNDYKATDAESNHLEEDASDPDSPDLEDADLQVKSSPIFRAQSVNYGQGHVRHISAGSAKLLDIRPSSADFKRRSLPQSERGSTTNRDSLLRRNSSDR